MKKIKQLLKKRGPRILAFVSCFLVLISCFSLSAFAVDEIPSPTDSITDVWTGVWNWIIGSFGSVQGVFYDGSSTSIMTILNPESSFVYEGVTYYEPLDYLNVPYEEFYLNGLLFWSEGNTFEQITIDGIVYDTMIVGSSIAVLIDDANSIMYFNPAITIGPPGGLTLLGTLAVIGLSIALVLLLIMVIRRFLALRS